MFESIGDVFLILGGTAAMIMYVKRDLCKDIRQNTANLNAHLNLSRKMAVEIISRISVLEHKNGEGMAEIQKKNERILTQEEAKT